ncbi:MAG: DEAD/DEAH box helicase, partial [Rectinema sp.]|nr:DEAD/DEAH box helicase [Rectinema sp.]
ISRAGYREPTPIQSQAIGPALEGRDILGLAQTGTGKTAAFVLPLLQRLLAGPRMQARALILSPTRELAEQTRAAIELLGKETNLLSQSIYGGVSMSNQIRAYRRDRPEILVACPGRLLDLMEQHVVSLAHIEMLVLDEADQMLDMGFIPSIRRIIASITGDRQTMLFSATLPPEIRRLAREFQRDPLHIEIGSSKPVDTVSHIVYPVMQADKLAVLSSILSEHEDGKMLIFARTKHRAQKLATHLSESGFPAAALHGNLTQAQRDKAMQRFRTGKAKYMVATDIAARGIDISGISHVVNFDMPDTAEAYTHRIGRTGRMMQTGIALTLATPDDHSMLSIVERLIGSPIEQKVVSLSGTKSVVSMGARFDREAGTGCGGQKSSARAIAGHVSSRSFKARGHSFAAHRSSTSRRIAV